MTIPYMKSSADYFLSRRPLRGSFFTTHSRYRDLIHSFKYHGAWNLSRNMGRLMGYALADGGLYKDIDLIIPVPLHPFRRWHRGYNQAEYLARGLLKPSNARLAGTT